jgi:tRNA G18 (ribose-2'-O)-methylase SpoU
MSITDQQLVVIAHDIRSAHNVGSLLRTAEGLGVTKVYLTGYTPHPAYQGDTRLPHLAAKQTRLIQKTALGAEASQQWEYRTQVADLLEELHSQGYVLAALEQAAQSIPLPSYRPPKQIALLLGREVEGIEPALLKACDSVLEIPMHGSKESYNVVQAAAMALYHLRFCKTSDS